MASTSTRRQAAIVTIAMTSARLAGRCALLAAAQDCVDMIGKLPAREARNMNRALEGFRLRVWCDGVELPELVSTLICLVSDQLAYVTGKKRAMFSKLLLEIETLLKLFDDDINHKRAFDAATMFGNVNF